MAGGVLAEVEVPLFIAGAAMREILRDSRSATCFIIHTKRLQDGTGKLSEAAGAR